jgi:signal transduction histidine kinase
LNLATIAQHVRQNPLLAKTVQEGQELVQELSKEIRTTSYLLHPPLLEENGLSDALPWYIQGVTERSGLCIELNISDNFGRLPCEMELAIFRIVQECLTNIHRHAGGKTAIIRISRDDERVSLEIQDDGVGMPAEKLAEIQTQRSGVGITGMRERVRHLKGVMSVESNDQGTRVLVRLPILTDATSKLESTLSRSKAAG